MCVSEQLLCRVPIEFSKPGNVLKFFFLIPGPEKVEENGLSLTGSGQYVGF